MSDSADWDPKTNLTTRTETTAVVTVERLTLFGSPQLLGGEDQAAYHELLGRLYAAVKPIDILDEMFINDVVSLEWEVLRWRRLKSSLMKMGALKKLEKSLNDLLNYGHYWEFFEQDLKQILQDAVRDQTKEFVQTLAHKCALDDPDANNKVNHILTRINRNIDDIENAARARKAKELAQKCFRGTKSAIKLVDKLLARAGLSINALMAEATADELDNIERIDRLATIAENRRNAALREIDRRRTVLGQALRRQVQEIEGDFKVIEKTPPAAKNAA